MATSVREKIVRIEESPSKESGGDEMSNTLIVPDDDMNARIIAQLDTRTELASAASQDNKVLVVLPSEGAVQEDDDLDDEAIDELHDLPEGWPKIPQIFERRSWDFSTTVSPSVNKAASHLELLQVIIEEWFKEGESGPASRMSSKKTAHSRPTTVLSQLSSADHLFSVPASRDRARRLRFLGSADSSTTERRSLLSRETQQLSIEGIGGKSFPAEEPNLQYELPYLGADEVLEEVITLLAKMENDRQEKRSQLKGERARYLTLKSKIDNHCMKKLKEIPMMVQAEHEACALDISELNWHVNYQSRNREKIQRNCEVAETLNQKLKEDIDFIKGHIPLVAEKLELEKEAMSRINQAQKDTDDELNITVQRCAKVKSKSDEAHMKAEEERAQIKRDLDNVKDDLARITEELSTAKMNFNSYIHLANDYRTQIQDNEQELKVLTVKNENSKAAEAIQDEKVKALQQRVKAAEYDQKKLEEDNEELAIDKEWKKNKNKEILAQRDETIERQKERLKLLRRKNKELDIKIEDLTVELNDCTKQKIADEKNLERMVKEMERTEKQYDETLEDLAQTQLLNGSTRETLQIEEDKTLQAEEQLRGTADALKRQVKEEMLTKATIAARISSDDGETDKFTQETTQKKGKVVKMVDEVETAVKSVQKKVDKLRNAHRERAKKIELLQKEKEKCEEETKMVIEECESKVQQLEPKHQAIKVKVEKLDKEIEKINWNTNMMTKKIEDMTSSGGVMERSITTTSKTIEKLDDKLGELNIQITENTVLDDEALSQLDLINVRMATNKKNHRELMEARNAVLARHEQDLKQNISWNTKLAARYRHLTNEFLVLKHQLLNQYDVNVNTEATIKDVKQLQGLQQKMHAAMNVYYKYRGLYNQGELERMQDESTKNGIRVGKLQSDMDVALDKISDFLQNQLDGNTIRRLAMEKVEREEQAEKAAIPTAATKRPAAATLSA